ncbi:enoyl-CoA hydratase/isomerase [Bordetella ansorpii]|uniref:Enoyl-CoA hydratase/isomerase n=1 Tax=Bordetella ansorpii TaxID=288768 RepID=A0A157NLU5_9BORD|nr:enoyl-CoA hydratase-related protein [Bordetella ansorpii]SAI22004.1 enoyl-CoA hydratase/isomerase [Bordetella ansorpii]
MNAPAEDTGVVSAREGAVLTLTINRPERRNALHLAAYGELTVQLKRANDDPGLAAVILTGAGTHFTAGNDLRDFQAQPNRPAGDSAGLAFLRALIDLDVPVIAAVEGYAIGVGVTLLQHCDFVHAADNATLRMPFTSLGLCPEGGSSLMMARLAGARKAAQWLLLGKAIDAREACEAGLVTSVTPAGGALAAAQATAAQLAALPAGSLRISKSLMRRADRAALHDTLSVEADAFRQRLATPEAQQAFAKFFEKK